ncbi:MAG TPA: thiosulfohydrolase SoxB, partial [Burkholderiaceae bacterium]|nr:thiosulfohydrolase SoxB [Burkholderiaceae bacterium]
MSLHKRECLQALAAAGAAGMALGRWAHADAVSAGSALYDVPPPFKGAGAVSLLHFTDSHAQLKPNRFREPSVNLA